MGQADADYQRFFCTRCGVQLRARLSQAGKQLPCPKCQALLTVPHPHPDNILTHANDRNNTETYGVRQPTIGPNHVISHDNHSGPFPTTTHQADGLYTINKSHDNTSPNGQQPPDSETDDQWRQKPDLLPSTRPKPPPWPLVQGVVSFLWTQGAILCWLMLSTLGTVLAFMLLASTALGQIPSPATWMGSMMFLASSFVLSLIFAILNGIYCLAILQESAAGNRIIEEWPGQTIFDQLAESLFFINSVLITALVAWLVTMPIAYYGMIRAFCEFTIFVIFFPIVLLSMLESGSCLLPASSALWQSIRRSWKTWLLFYVESFTLAFGFWFYLALLAYVIGRHEADLTIQLGLLIVAMAVGPGTLLEMIYFRLMGRLAWVCDEDARREMATKEDNDAEEQNQSGVSEIRETPVDDF